MLDFVTSKGYFKQINLPSDRKSIFPQWSVRKMLRTLLNAMGAPIMDHCCETPETITLDEAEISLKSFVSKIDTTDGAIGITLADGNEGQYKFIKMTADGGDAVVTVDNLKGGTTITFDAVGDFAYLFFLGEEWNVITNGGVAVA